MIREVTLRRFKRFEEETFDLSGNVILAGPNNCGKTTVLQALSAWALALRTWRARNDFRKHGGAYSRVPVARQAFSAVPLRSYDLLWKDRRYEGLVCIEVRLDDGLQVTMELHKDSTEQVYVRPHKAVDSSVVRTLEFDVTYVATIGGLSVEEPVYQPEYIRTLLGRQRSGDVVRNLLLQASHGANWEKLTDAVQRVFGAELLVPETPGGTILCEYRQRADGPTFDLLSAGSGFQQVVLLLASLFTRHGSVILVDEPDAHLHVFLQDTIFAELKRAAAETGSQLVLATHSEVIFNRAEPQELCILMGAPRRLGTPEEVRALREAMGILDQADLIAALCAPGVLYLDGYTDLNLLRVWAQALEHPVATYLNQTPYFKEKTPENQDGREEIVPGRHYQALQLARSMITGVWLLDGDARPGNMTASPAPEPGRLLRQIWRLYEIESYLLHPAALARFLDTQVGSSGEETVRAFFVGQFGTDLSRVFHEDPSAPPPLVENFLRTTKARTLLESLLSAAGMHNIRYQDFDQIAAQMQPDEIHPEVIEKLDFIQKAFGL